MAQWQRLMAVCRESYPFHQRLSELYIRVGFPIKIRSSLSQWIEAQDWLERFRLFTVKDKGLTSCCHPELAPCGLGSFVE